MCTFFILLATFPLVILFGIWKMWKDDFAQRTIIHHERPPKNRRNEYNEKEDDGNENGDCDGEADHEADMQTDMDSLYIGFWDFALCLMLIIPSQQFVFWKEFLSLNFRRFVQSKIFDMRGTRFLKNWEPRVVCGAMLLETSEMVYLVDIDDKREDGRSVGTYRWEDFMYLSNKGDLKCAETVEMKVDLDSKLLLSAHLDRVETSATEAVQLLSMHVATVIHPVLHTYSNWGIDTTHPDPYVRRMSIVTIIYNYLGSTWFPRSTLPFLCRWGRIFESDHMSPDVTDNMRHILHSEWLKGLPSTSPCARLAPYSTLAKFVTSLCEKFCNIFDKYTDDFKGIDKKAMFTGTVLHSLDHSMFTRVLEDPLWLFLDDTDFTASGKIAAFANACLSRDLPGLVFERHFKDAEHPFYKEVYLEAKKLNPELADMIDTCIIK